MEGWELEAIFIETELRGRIFPTVEDHLREAMRIAQGRPEWTRTEDEQTRAALGGVLLSKSCSPEDKARIESEVRMFRALAVAASGIPVDFGALLAAEGETHPNPIGLRRIWMEVKEATAKVAPSGGTGGNRDGVRPSGDEGSPDAVRVAPAHQSAVPSPPLNPEEPCPKCNGEKRVANTEDEEPWSAWASLPPGSDAAVKMGIVRPKPCPRCQP